MKKTLLLIAVFAACFAAGYWARDSRVAADSSDSKQGHVAAATAHTAEASARSGAALPENEVRAFTAGRPFAKGGAKAWLLGLAAQHGSDPHDKDAWMVDMAGDFMTMDEASAAETCEALLEILALRKTGDPSLKALNIKVDMTDGAYLLTVLRLSQLNPAAALDALKNLPPEIPDKTVKMIFGRLAGKELARAEEMVSALPSNKQDDAMVGIFSFLNSQKPTAALAFAEKNSGFFFSSNGISGHYVSAMNDLMKLNPQQGIAAAVSITEKLKDSRALQNAFTSWLQLDQNTAMAWAAHHTGHGHAAVQAAIVQQQANSDPRAAAEAFAKLDAGPAAKTDLSRASATIAHKLVTQDADSARTWIETLQAGAARDAATYQLAQSWTEKDPAGASAWIKTLPAGDIRDDASRALIHHITTRDPAAAYEWARNISNEASRKETMYQVMIVWKDQDPLSAQAAADEPAAKP